MLSTSLIIGYTFISVAFGFSLFRVIQGPSPADRIVGLDLTAGLSLCAIALMAIDSKQSLLLDVAVCIALLAFISTVAFARYLRRKAEES